MTEITDKKDEAHPLLPLWRRQGPWIFYDASCGLCSRGRELLGPLMERRGFRLAPLASEPGQYAARDGVDEMKVMTHTGDILGGAHAIAYLASFVWWAQPVAWLWALRLPRPLLRFLYRRIANNRRCFDGLCRLPQP